MTEIEHLLADHRAMQQAFLDLLTRVQRLEAAEERRTFAGAVSDLRSQPDIPAALREWCPEA